MAQCPVCQFDLQPPPVGWHADAHCGRCGGVWITSSRLEDALTRWRVNASFEEHAPSTDFCPSCGPVPLDEGTLLGQTGLSCSLCGGVFMRQPLRYERSKQTAIPTEQQVTHESRPIRPQPIPPSRPKQSELSPQEAKVSLERPTEAPNRGKQRARRTPPKKTEKQLITHPTPRQAPQLPQVTRSDLFLFGGLVAGIIASLVYWMEP